ncbi:hypothetical protein ABID56_002551 [Alkalibacillus flavidus]|uniref:Replication protein n=1 Tax=Alkalibacillus flavidus TaxID=546021 RepID=A0ABV2KYC6_9BACI
MLDNVNSNDKRVIQETVLDKETGELISKKEYNGEDHNVENIFSHEIRRKYAIQKNMRKTDERGEFVFLKLDAVNDMSKSLSFKELGYFMLLLPYVSYDENYLKYDKKTFVTTKDLESIWTLSKDGVRQRLKSWRNLNILDIESNPDDSRKNVMVLNPELVTKGMMTKKERKEKQKVKVYQHVLSRLIDNLDETLKERKGNMDYLKILGFLMLLFSGMHYDSYYLVNNPEHELSVNSLLKLRKHKDEELDYLSVSSLGQLTQHPNMNRQTIKRYVGVLVETGALALVDLEQDNAKRLLMNPVLVYRKDNDGRDEYTQSIKKQFNDLVHEHDIYHQIETVCQSLQQTSDFNVSPHSDYISDLEDKLEEHEAKIDELKRLVHIKKQEDRSNQT